MTKSEAIHAARQHVSELRPLGDSWFFETFVPTLNAQYQHQPRQYAQALAARSQALVDKARDFLGLDFRTYDGGSWTNYLD